MTISLEGLDLDALITTCRASLARTGELRAELIPAAGQPDVLAPDDASSGFAPAAASWTDAVGA